MYDFGYDIADFYQIQEEYGTMEDFQRLLARAKELGKNILFLILRKVFTECFSNFINMNWFSPQISKLFLILCQIIQVMKVCGLKKH